MPVRPAVGRSRADQGDARDAALKHADGRRHANAAGLAPASTCRRCASPATFWASSSCGAIAAAQLAAMITEMEAYKGPRDRAVAHLRRTAHRARRAAVRRRRHCLRLPGVRDALAAQFQHGRRRNPGGRADPRRSDRRWRKAEAGIGAGPSHCLSSSRSAARSYRCDAVDATCGSRTAASALPARRIMTGPRVGIDYAGAYWAARRWRFWIDSPADLSDVVKASCRT